MTFAHKGLQALYEHERTEGLPQNLVPRIRRILADLDAADHPATSTSRAIDCIHPGNRAGQWSVRLSGNRRIFCFADGVAVDVDLVDYHY